MKNFLDINNKSFHFSNCNSCEARCCDGRKGSLFAQIILDDFELVHKNFPILFIFGELGYLKPVILLSNGKDFCPYIKENRCTIYDQRPSICRLYPLSPNVDAKIYIDDSCPAVTIEPENGSTPIVKEGEVTKDFYYKSLESYQDKYIETHFEFEKINAKEDFEIVTHINNITFYKYIGDTRTPYIKYHQISLNNNFIN